MRALYPISDWSVISAQAFNVAYRKTASLFTYSLLVNIAEHFLGLYILFLSRLCMRSIIIYTRFEMTLKQVSSEDPESFDGGVGEGVRFN